jgi:hypothetical protein
MAVLPLNEPVSSQIRHVGRTRMQLSGKNHPADVGPEKAPAGIIRVQIGVCVSVVGPMSARPPVAGSLDGTGAPAEKKKLQWEGSVVRAVGP